MFKRYRIIEIKGKFIPQFRETFLKDWSSYSPSSGFKWIKLKSQIEYCSLETFEEAVKVIDKFIEDKYPVIKVYKY